MENKRHTFFLDSSVWKRLRYFAYVKDRSVSDLIREAITEWIKKEELNAKED